MDIEVKKRITVFSIVSLLRNPWCAQGLNHLNHETNEETSILRLILWISGSSANHGHNEILRFRRQLQNGLLREQCHVDLLTRPNFSNPYQWSVFMDQSYDVDDLLL